MKTLPLLLIQALFLFAACTKQNGTPVTPGTGTIDTSVARRVYSGTFSNGPYGAVSGQSHIYDNAGTYLLKLEKVNISNGPDLHVYLSRELFPVNYTDLGKLQSISGDQVYSITGSPDFSQYKYVLVHCQRFNHLFGSAELR